MSEEKKTHWKRLVNPDYLGAYSLDEGKDVVLTISQVKVEKVKNERGSEDCVVARFLETTAPGLVEAVKPMILNKTNMKSIAKVYQTNFVEDWAGKKIQIYGTTTKMKNEVVECLRIREIAPATKPVLTLDSPQFDEAKKYIKDGGKIEKIAAKYMVSKEVAEALHAE